MHKNRSSHSEVFCKKGILSNFAKFTEKHLCQRLVFKNLLKKSLWHRCFPVNFAKFLKTPFFTEHLRQLLPQKTRGEMFCTFAGMMSLMLNSKLCNFITSSNLTKTLQNLVQGSFSINFLKIRHKDRGEVLASGPP